GRTVSGRQTYVLDYDVRGAMNAFPDHAEVFWNAVGTEWSAAVRRATVAVEGPAPPTEAACYAGPDGSGLPCTSSRVASGGARARAGSGADRRRLGHRGAPAVHRA